MSIALQVEKTSKRGGRIIHEKELMLPPPAVPSPPPVMPQIKEQPTITEIMKAPSKVVLLRVIRSKVLLALTSFIAFNFFNLSEHGWSWRRG